MEDSKPGQDNALSNPTATNQPFASTNTPLSSSSNQEETETNLGHYKLRALNQTNNISAALEANWLQAPPRLPASLNVSAFSSELVNETLNYFVNCGNRLTQMTKTYDDSDAYILLLQEKVVDLELAARIGHDLLRQNEELKKSVASLKDELDKRQDHVQQLKHELASKTVLLGTLIEEEENQSSFEDSEPNSTTTLLRCQDQPQPSHSQQQKANNKHSSQPVVIAGDDFNYDDGHAPNRFLSLNYNSPKPSSHPPVEPFSSLPHYLNLNTSAPNYSTSTTFKQHHQYHDQQHQHDFVGDADSNSTTLSQEEEEEEELDHSAYPVFSESNKRLYELQDEILYKSEQNSMQQEKILSLQEQLRESDRRLGDVASDNETLLKSMDETKEIHKELKEELRICKRNFNELLRVFLAMQEESRVLRNETFQRNSTLNYLGEEEVLMQDDDFVNDTFDSFNTTSATKPPNPRNNNHKSTPCESCCHPSQSVTSSTSNTANTRTNISASPSLLEELQETLGNKDQQQKSKYFQSSEDEESENERNYENDSGVIMNNTNSTSATPTAYTLTDTETDDKSQLCDSSTDSGRGWLGLSSFVITTILLLCLSVTFRSSPNSSLPRKLQLKLD